MQEKYLIGMQCTVKEAIEKMELEQIKAVVIVDKQNRVAGLFSNGYENLLFKRRFFACQYL